MIVGIHQPNFFPWLGFFNRILSCERFIFLDHVQIPTGKSWVSRNKLLISGADRWLTLPTKKRSRMGQRIDEVEINYESNFTKKHLRTIESNYGKTQYFKEVFPIIQRIYTADHKLLVDFNLSFIHWVLDSWQCPTKCYRSSQLIAINPSLMHLTGNELILEICATVDAKKYISGSGCLDFIKPNSFEERYINFNFQSFSHPEYDQIGAQQFRSNLSILDCLFNQGLKRTQTLVNPKDLR